jgi:hypothetical protein
MLQTKGDHFLLVPFSLMTAFAGVFDEPFCSLYL